MKFAKTVFWAAGLWGVVVITPLFFIFDLIGRQDPPPITHPGFYYGFATAALAWQLVFFVIASDPVRFRTLMLPSMFEKFSYGVVVFTLYFQGRMRRTDLVLGIVDVSLGMLFIAVFSRTKLLAHTSSAAARTGRT